MVLMSKALVGGLHEDLSPRSVLLLPVVVALVAVTAQNRKMLADGHPRNPSNLAPVL